MPCRARFKKDIAKWDEIVSDDDALAATVYENPIPGDSLREIFERNRCYISYGCAFVCKSSAGAVKTETYVGGTRKQWKRFFVTAATLLRCFDIPKNTLNFRSGTT